MQRPFHEIGQIFTGAGETGFDMSILRVDPPVHEEVLAVRVERQRPVTEFLATATAELLAVGAPALHPRRDVALMR